MDQFRGFFGSVAIQIAQQHVNAMGSAFMSQISLARSGRVSRPSTWLFATKLPRAVAEAGLFAAWLPMLLALAQRGDGHPVIILPGMLASDDSTLALRAALRMLGHDVRGWGLGRNSGTRAVGPQCEKLLDMIDRRYDETGMKISLVGWSLGGVLARLAARRGPDRIRQVVTLGSPFASNPRATNAWPIYEAVSQTRVDSPAIKAFREEMQQPLEVPFTAIYSKADGICPWRSCTGPVSQISENIEVLGSHCGLGANPLVFYAIADRLAQHEGAWAPFETRRAASIFPISSTA
jgi:pimeloyl-ACP methyl ester carboxylesterase